MTRNPSPRLRSRWITWCISCLSIATVFNDCSVNPAIAQTPPLFAAPQPGEQDEILLLSTRRIGARCDDQLLQHQLDCYQLTENSSGCRRWQAIDWRGILSHEKSRPTLIYVHGNRVSQGKDRVEGLRVYRSYVQHTRPATPIRFIIWSWPADRIPGPIKDYRLKAHRTRPAGWQLAWLVDKLPEETPLGLIGYSYGARVVCTATHLLAGGAVDSLALADRWHPERQPVQVALIAAAFDADWIQPGHYLGRAVYPVEKMTLGTNRLDPAMRYFHWSNGRGRIHALGKAGPAQPAALGPGLRRIHRIDFAASVGRSHQLSDYLQAHQEITRFWQQLSLVPHEEPQFSSAEQEAADSAT